MSSMILKQKNLYTEAVLTFPILCKKIIKTHFLFFPSSAHNLVFEVHWAKADHTLLDIYTSACWLNKKNLTDSSIHIMQHGQINLLP